MSVCTSLKILVTTEPIGFYPSGNIPTGPVVVLGYLFTIYLSGRSVGHAIKETFINMLIKGCVIFFYFLFSQHLLLAGGQHEGLL